MNTVSHVPTENQIKQFAKAIRSALRELHDFEINHTQALEISSRAHGCHFQLTQLHSSKL